MVTLGLAFVATAWAASAMLLLLLAVLAIIIDAAVQANQVVSQRIIFSVGGGDPRPGQCALYDDHLRRRRARLAAGHDHLPPGRLDGDRCGWWPRGRVTLLLFAAESRRAAAR